VSQAPSGGFGKRGEDRGKVGEVYFGLKDRGRTLVKKLVSGGDDVKAVHSGWTLNEYCAEELRHLRNPTGG